MTYQFCSMLNSNYDWNSTSKQIRICEKFNKVLICVQTFQ